MLDKNKHQAVMTQIIKDIYSDIYLSSLLGFKGETAAYFFFDLPRFSVDLDFDLLEDSKENRKAVFEKVSSILQKYGEIRDSQSKFFTIYFSLSYEKGEHQIKLEINTRPTGAKYEMKNYLGIPVLVSSRESMVASKLIALTNRKTFAYRDLYDTHFFLKNRWNIDEDVLKIYGENSLEEYLLKCVKTVEKLPNNEMLKGLGELIDEKEKKFVKEELRKDTLFLLKLYLDLEKKSNKND
jgi:predicted nucleotidyltransferase component of viral defense system